MPAVGADARLARAPGPGLKMYRVLLLPLLLCGCAAIDYQHGLVAGLAQMTVEEHYIDASEIYPRCSRCAALGSVLPLACTCINFRTQHAVIWLAHGAPPETIEHERAHGRGYDHPSGELRRQYTAWLNSDRRRVILAAQPAASNEIVSDSAH